MRKKIIALTFFVIIAMCFHACDFALPEQVEVRVKPELGVQVNGEMSNIILDMIKNATKDNEDINVYQYTDKKIMTFLLQYNIKKDYPLDYFDQFDDILNKFDIELPEDEMNQTIDLAQITEFFDVVDPVPVEIDLTKVLTSAEDSLRFDPTDSENGENENMKIIPIGLGLGEYLSEEDYSFKVSLKKFEDVTFANGLLTVHLELVPKAPSTAFVGVVDFSFDTIYIKYDNTIIPGYLKDNPGSPIQFSAPDYTSDVEFNLMGRTIPKEFKIHIEDFHDGTQIPQAASLIIYESTVEPPPNVNPTPPLIKGVTGYAVEEDDDDFKFEIDKNVIELEYEGNEFVHAQIGKGSIFFDIALPKPGDNPQDPDPTWITLVNDNNNDIIKEIWIHQAAVQDGGHWSGLSRRTTNKTGSDIGGGLDTEPWFYVEPSGGDGNLSGKHINLNEIVILGNEEGENPPDEISMIKIPKGTISLMLSDEVLAKEKKTFEINITPKLNIETLEFAHIKPGDIFKPMTKEIDLKEAAQYIREIHFDKVGIELQFGQVDISGLEIMVSEKNLGINFPSPVFKPIPLREEGDPPTPSVKFINESAGGIILTLNNIDGSPLIETLTLEVEIKGDTNDGIMELKDVDLSKPSLRLEIEDYTVYFKENWTKAILDLESMDVPLKGSFPEEEDDPINLASMLEMLQGFKVKGIESYLYIDAPEKFINLDPDVTLEAKDGNNNEPYDLFFGKEFKLEAHKLPELDKDGDGKFTGEFAKGIKINFQPIMDDLPEDLRITYDFGFENGLIIFPEFLENGADGETANIVNIAIIVVVPMSLENTDAGSKFEIPNMFKDEDAFGRTKEGEDGPYLGYINSLTLKVEFNDEVFKGGTLYMKKEGEEDGKETLRFDLKGKSLSIPIKGDLLKTIRETYPYNIVEMGIRFDKKTTIQIPNNLAIKKIEFDADVTFGFEF